MSLYLCLSFHVWLLPSVDSKGESRQDLERRVFLKKGTVERDDLVGSPGSRPWVFEMKMITVRGGSLLVGPGFMLLLLT